MITGNRKPLEELRQAIGDAQNILVLGCGTCTTVSQVGGEKQVSELAEALTLLLAKEGKKAKIATKTILRQCDPEFFDDVEEDVKKADVLVSLACGAGVQTAADKYPKLHVTPALNTTSIGANLPEEDAFRQACSACGRCVLEKTLGLCPITRCAKSLLNGPCGGVRDGLCEVDDVPCVWVQIFNKMKDQDRLDEFLTPRLPEVGRR
ncbi:MAG: methylenetetrahydrofolate reductase C-terminal domain-containing protein [Candidatus Altiarchaeota archaeon]